MKKTKPFLWLYILLSILFFMWVAVELFPGLKYNLSSAEADHLKNLKKPLIFAGDHAYPPFSFYEDGDYTGYEADLMVYLENELDTPIVYKQMHWDDAVKALELGEIDVITGMKINAERRAKYLFTDPYLITTQALVTLKTLGPINDNNLKDYRVVVQEGSVTVKLAQDYGAKEIIRVKDPEEGMHLLLQKKADAWFVNNMTALYYIRLTNHKKLLKIDIIEDTKGHYGMAVGKDKGFLVDILNKKLHYLEDRGSLSFLDQKWFGINVQRPHDEKSKWIYFFMVFYIFLSLLFFAYLWNKTLKHRLDERTTEVQKANTVIEQEKKNIEKLLKEISTSFAVAIDYRDIYTGNHSRRVAVMSVEIAKAMGLSSKNIFETYVGALVHDVGKVGIPDTILKKESALNDEEYAMIQRHPEIGSKILDNLNAYETIKNIVYCHHERWDGRTTPPFPAYPGKVKGEEIPLAARIVAVADAYDAMTTDRPYRKAMDLESARKRLKADAGKQFDPKVVACFLRLLRESPEWQLAVIMAE